MSRQNSKSTLWNWLAEMWFAINCMKLWIIIFVVNYDDRWLSIIWKIIWKLFKHLSLLAFVTSSLGRTVKINSGNNNNNPINQIIISREKKVISNFSVFSKSRLKIDPQTHRSFHNSETNSTTMKKIRIFKVLKPAFQINEMEI